MINEGRLEVFAKQAAKLTPPYKNRYPSRHRRELKKGLKKLAKWPLKPPQPLPIVRHNSFQDNQLTWLGHASFLIQVQGLTIITDPVFSSRCSPYQWLGPKRYTPNPYKLAELPKIDVVLISHNHYDHLDEESIKAIQRLHQPLFLVPQGLAQWFTKRNIHHVTERLWWQSVAVNNCHFYCLPVQHFSRRGLHDKNQSLWCGWRIQHQDYSVFFAGDTGFSKDFEDIASVFPSVDVALLPIGAYGPEMIFSPIHCTPEEAVEIHSILQAKQSYAMHWGTFVLTAEPVDEPPKRLAQALAAQHLSADAFKVLRHGESAAIHCAPAV